MKQYFNASSYFITYDSTKRRLIVAALNTSSFPKPDSPVVSDDLKYLPGCSEDELWMNLSAVTHGSITGEAFSTKWGDSSSQC